MFGNEAGWRPVVFDAEAGSVALQLTEVASMMAGRPHRLASFGEALEGQRVIEATQGLKPDIGALN
ncbi:hypothetical protein [Shewanella salipaludis]|uniref:Uncharacterized protein n=1 Tax=Shewanella salipaludis TaxID=2723052 RepID=A0A972FX92_9GAMM|nr:hypothetical protein [Shewanella salipaludis]NMH64337.1 hypothetical protein [Shewanella salipaludis]